MSILLTPIKSIFLLVTVNDIDTLTIRKLAIEVREDLYNKIKDRESELKMWLSMVCTYTMKDTPFIISNIEEIYAIQPAVNLSIGKMRNVFI